MDPYLRFSSRVIIVIGVCAVAVAVAVAVATWQGLFLIGIVYVMNALMGDQEAIFVILCFLVWLLLWIWIGRWSFARSHFVGALAFTVLTGVFCYAAIELLAKDEIRSRSRPPIPSPYGIVSSTSATNRSLNVTSAET